MPSSRRGSTSPPRRPGRAAAVSPAERQITIPARGAPRRTRNHQGDDDDDPGPIERRSGGGPFRTAGPKVCPRCSTSLPIRLRLLADEVPPWLVALVLSQPGGPKSECFGHPFGRLARDAMGHLTIRQ